MKSEIIDEINASIGIKNAITDDTKLICQIDDLSNACLNALKSGGKIIFAGNGGSFADAQHLSAEFISRFRFDRAPLASLVLGANSSAVTAIGNDYGFEKIFSRELIGVAKSSDVFIPISTSANSPNILEAVEQARKLGLVTAALTGQSGGKLKGICDCLCVPSSDTARIQECHIMIGHIICGAVERRYFEDVS